MSSHGSQRQFGHASKERLRRAQGQLAKASLSKGRRGLHSGQHWNQALNHGLVPRPRLEHGDECGLRFLVPGRSQGRRHQAHGQALGFSLDKYCDPMGNRFRLNEDQRFDLPVERRVIRFPGVTFSASQIGKQAVKRGVSEILFLNPQIAFVGICRHQK